jgi:hypothetical protein
MMMMMIMIIVMIMMMMMMMIMIIVMIMMMMMIMIIVMIMMMMTMIIMVMMMRMFYFNKYYTEKNVSSLYIHVKRRELALQIGGKGHIKINKARIPPSTKSIVRTLVANRD